MQANLLKAKMAEKGYSQKSLAEAVGMSENALSYKILGRRAFDVDEILAICSVLNIKSGKEKVDIFLTSSSQK